MSWIGWFCCGFRGLLGKVLIFDKALFYKNYFIISINHLFLIFISSNNYCLHYQLINHAFSYINKKSTIKYNKDMLIAMSIGIK